MRNILKNKRGEGHIGTAMKIIIGVVIGALILGGLYLLFDNVILDSTAARIEALFDVSQDNMSARCELDESGQYHLQYTYDGEQWFEAELVDMSADASVKAFVSDGKETPTYCAVVIDGNKFHVIASEDGGVTWNSRKAWDYNGNTSNFLLTYSSGFKLTFKTGSTNYTATSADGLTWSDAWSEIHRPTYTADQMKTEKQFYVSGLNCDEKPDAAQKQFEITKRRFKKEGGIVCFHGYQSFAPGEVTPEVAHAIGIKLAEELWGDRFEVLVTTHLNTKAVHNHFCLNSVSFADGLRYYDQKATYKKMREVSDALCREWGLSVIEPKGRGRHIGEIKDEENGKLTMRGQIKADIDQAIKENYSWQSFCKVLGGLGYVTEWRGSFFRIRPDYGKKFFRFDRLGEGYSVEDIRRRLNENYYQLHRQEEEPFVVPKRDKAKGLYALFLHYQYLLGHLPKSRPPNDPEAYAQMKADRKKLQQYSDAAKLLGKYQIYTAEQLHNHTEKISEQFKSLAIQRKKLQNRLKRMHDSERMQPIKDQVAALTERMTELRKEMRICTNVAEWSDAVEVIVNRMENPEISKERESIQEKDVPRS